MKGRFRSTLLAVVTAFFIVSLSSCSTGGDRPPELVQGVQVIREMMAPMHIRRTAYVVAFEVEEQRPSNFVSYLFSSMGSAEWPPSEEWADEMEREQMRAIRATMSPAGVAFVSREPDPDQEKQVVVRFDDDVDLVIVDAYLDPEEEPLFTTQLDFRPAKPDKHLEEGLRMIYRSNAELGMRFQSF